MTTEALATTTAVEAALGEASEGDRISREQALLLFGHGGLGPLLRAAAFVRHLSKGSTVTYSKKVFLPLTHLCRDYCGYCTFRADPASDDDPFMTPQEVLELAEAGRQAGCKEALFSLGDQPERVFPEAKKFLRKQGFERTLEYLAAMTQLVRDEIGLLPHSNPGVMDASDLKHLKESNVSLGLMLETTSLRLRQTRGPHWKAPDKVPSIRLKTIEEAGRLSIAFTTGILIGIGETVEERVDSLLAIRDLDERYGHIQEVIVQPFRAKPETRMADADEPPTDDLLRTLAIARLIFGGDMNIQSPPNLLSSDFPVLLEAGMNDWGGISPVTKDFINPEAAWPQISFLKEKTAAAGFVLRERLAIYPEFSSRPGFVDEHVQPCLQRLQGQNGYARTE
ncbi:MAG TPA: 7,8-didemethyl-8-hydroxy-5-deazariboflavin synthase CofG [Candidatus Dormibacteraeota bacterium]|nr:7,8-didemethyl-8-hydroxy-5-deazariboflavin synthase CofG [Candidatus Dormibacteraeota bacterium]